MPKDFTLDGLTPGELFAATNRRRSVIDPRKSREELSPSDLLLLQNNSEELARYNRDRIEYLLERQGQLLSKEPSIEELLDELYGKKRKKN